MSTPATGFDARLFAGWPPRQQYNALTCVAHAVVAAYDLLRHGPEAGANHVWPASSARALHTLMGTVSSNQPPDLGALGFRKLGQAMSVLRRTGLCPLSLWPDYGSLLEMPSEGALAAATPSPDLVFGHVDSHEGKDPNPLELVTWIKASLAAQQPVAVSLPAYNPTGQLGHLTNWTASSVQMSGNVRDPRPDEKPVWSSGHAVCLVAFQADLADVEGGYFVFRNAEGYSFGSSPPIPGSPPPCPPAPGYGTISARHVQAYCWEVLTFTITGDLAWDGPVDKPDSAVPTPG